MSFQHNHFCSCPMCKKTLDFYENQYRSRLNGLCLDCDFKFKEALEKTKREAELRAALKNPNDRF